MEGYFQGSSAVMGPLTVHEPDVSPLPTVCAPGAAGPSRQRHRSPCLPTLKFTVPLPFSGSGKMNGKKVTGEHPKIPTFLSERCL